MKLVSDRKIPHIGPEKAKILFLSDCPTEVDNRMGKPFSGAEGDILLDALIQSGIDPEQCRFGNLLNYQPAANDFKRANQTPEMEESRRELSVYLDTFSPDVIVPMGENALFFLTSFNQLSKRRGSVYQYKKSFVVPMYHPYLVNKVRSHTPAFFCDLNKIKRILDKTFVFPEFSFIIDPDVFTLEALLPTLLNSPRLYVDIESKRDSSYIRCIGFAWSTTEAVCIFNDSYEGIGPNFRRVVKKLLGSSVPKTFHNGFFDVIMLALNGLETESWDKDTMLNQHALQPELEKGLAYCTSIYTDINYYKDDGKEVSAKIDKQKLGRYNCLDTVATAQVQLGQEKEFDDVTRAMADFSMSQMPMAMNFSQSGMLVDEERRLELETAINEKRKKAYTVLCGVLLLMGIEPISVTQTKAVQNLLYKHFGLPVKTKRSGSVTADEDAIVSLIATVLRNLQGLKTEKAQQPWVFKHAALKAILLIRGYDKLLSSYILAKTSIDNRHRSQYKIAGTETGRWSAAMWFDDTGLNLQTLPREVIEI